MGVGRGTAPASPLSGAPHLTPRRRHRQPPAWFLVNTDWREDFWVPFKEESVCEDPSPLQVSRLGVLDEFPVTRKPGTPSKPRVPGHEDTYPWRWAGPAHAHSHSPAVRGNKQGGPRRTEKAVSRTTRPRPAKLRRREKSKLSDLSLGGGKKTYRYKQHFKQPLDL